MNAASSRTWVVGSLLVAIVLVAMTWFLVIGPTRTDTRTLDADTAGVQLQNDLLVAENARLSQQAESQEQLETEVRGALAALPEDVALPDFNRQLALQAAARGVTVSSISVSPAAAQGAPAADGTIPTGVLGVPITIQTKGPALSQLFFLRDVQEVGPRAVLVNATSLSALDTETVDDASTLTTQLTVYTSALSAADSEQLAEVLRGVPAAG